MTLEVRRTPRACLLRERRDDWHRKPGQSSRTLRPQLSMKFVTAGDGSHRPAIAQSHSGDPLTLPTTGESLPAMWRHVLVRILAVIGLTIFASPSMLVAQQRLSAREMGVVVGILPPGPRNAITDVGGVLGRLGRDALGFGDPGEMAGGSTMIVVATDAPLSQRNLERAIPLEKTMEILRRYGVVKP